MNKLIVSLENITIALPEDKVIIEKAEEETVLVKFSRESFLHTLREKMSLV